MNKLITIHILLSLCTSMVLSHEGHVNNASWDACHDAKKEDVCSYQNNKRDLFRGTCQLFDTKLMCVRNQPIIKSREEVSK